MNEVKVFGHLAPDTDATVSAMVCAWYLQTHKQTPAKAYLCGEINREAEFVLKRFGMERPELLGELTSEDRVAIVDTNNPEELPRGMDIVQITGIVDHHKLVGGLSTAEPISVVIYPLASTCSVLWRIMETEGITDVPGQIAGLMLAAVLSDTLKFTSPTTTEYDRRLAAKLALISNVDVDRLAEEMFAAKSNLEGFSARDILLTDSKIFKMGAKKVRVSVLETTAPENAMKLKQELIEEMNVLKKEENVDLAMLFVVDILKTESEVLVAGDEEGAVVVKAFGDSKVLAGVVSRKKQMVPALEKVVV